MDDKSIYFRTKDFKSGVEAYYMVDKSNFTKEKISSIDLNPYEDKRLIYDIDRQKVFVREEKEDNIEIKEILNRQFQVTHPKNLGDFYNIIEDRWLVTGYWVEDEEDNYFQYTIIKDLKTQEVQKYEGNCDIYEDELVLY